MDEYNINEDDIVILVAKNPAIILANIIYKFTISFLVALFLYFIFNKFFDKVTMSYLQIAGLVLLLSCLFRKSTISIDITRNLYGQESDKKTSPNIWKAVWTLNEIFAVIFYAVLTKITFKSIALPFAPSIIENWFNVYQETGFFTLIFLYAAMSGLGAIFYVLHGREASFLWRMSLFFLAPLKTLIIKPKIFYILSILVFIVGLKMGRSFIEACKIKGKTEMP